jgi:hypothetical protein
MEDDIPTYHGDLGCPRVWVQHLLDAFHGRMRLRRPECAWSSGFAESLCAGKVRLP